MAFFNPYIVINILFFLKILSDCKDPNALKTILIMEANNMNPDLGP